MRILFTIALAIIVAFGPATWTGQITGNLSPSAPKGLYLATEEADASYVTFCLQRDHANFSFYTRFCSPDASDGPPILKPIAERLPDGALIVRGIAPRSIDSKLLGPITRDQVQGYWRYLGG